MAALARRSNQPEWMDGPEVSADDYRQCLADLASVNRVTLTHLATLRWLDRAIHDFPAGSTLTVLDVAYGYGDLLRLIHRFAERRQLQPRLQGIDLNPASSLIAQQATPTAMNILYWTGNVFTFRPKQLPDFIVCSQFTHHLTDEQVVRFLQWLDANAKHGWYIADLQRQALSYYAFPLLARVMRWHPIVRHDGAVSIARSFSRSDWQRLLAQAGITAEISWHMPCRLCVGRLK